MQTSIPDSAHRLAPAALQPADVLLYHGNDPFARAIQYFDSSPYFHAALALEGERVAEAVMAGGIDERSLAETFARREWALVRRYRTESVTEALEPVVACARDVACDRQRYAGEQLVPLAVLLLTRKVPRTASTLRLAVGVLRAAATRLELQAVADGHRHRPLVCSGLVAYCFAEALPKGRYALSFQRAGSVRSGPHIDQQSLLAELLDGSRPVRRGVRSSPASIPSDQELEQLVSAALDELARAEDRGTRAAWQASDAEQAAREFAEAFCNLAEAPQLSTGGVRGGGRRDALARLAGLAEQLVTPGDLARSTSLVDVGALVPR